MVGHLKLPLENVSRLVSTHSCRELYSLASRGGSSIYYSKARLMARTPWSPHVAAQPHYWHPPIGIGPCGLTVLVFDSLTTILA